MISSGSPPSSSHTICSYAAGIAGNLFALVLFISPIPTFRRIIRSQSTQQFSGLPCIYSLLNCLICSFYGLPCVSQGVILVATVNIVGALFQLVYTILFIAYAENTKRNLVIRTRSVEFMPFYLSLATFLMSSSFFAYGLLLQDFFIYIPNGIGTVLGIVQLFLYGFFSRKPREESRQPLVISNE